MGNYLNNLVALIIMSLSQYFSKEAKEGFLTIERAEAQLANGDGAPSFIIGGSKGILDTNDVYVLVGYQLNYKKAADDATITFSNVAASGADANQIRDLRRLFEDGTHKLEITNSPAIPQTPNRIFQFPPALIQGFPAGFVPMSKLVAFSGNSAVSLQLKASGTVAALGTGIACLDLLLYRVPNVGSATFSDRYEIIEIE